MIFKVTAENAHSSLKDERFLWDNYVALVAVLIETVGIKKPLNYQGFFYKYGGEGGIRTHDKISPIHAFQASSFSHSDTSPQLPNKLIACSRRANIAEQRH